MRIKIKGFLGGADVQLHSFLIEHGQRAVAGDCRLPDADGSWPAVLLMPDILLSRQHGFYPFLADSLSEVRLVVTYDGSMTGYSADGTGFDADVARRYTLGSELLDVVALVRALTNRQLPFADTWNGQLALVGHGKGAALALHADRRLRAEGLATPSALGLLAPPATMVREGWVGESGRGAPVVEVPHDRSGGVELGGDFLDDARLLAELATLGELIETTPAATVLVAGEEDQVFEPSEAESLFQLAKPPRDRLVVVEKAGHHFGAAHPLGDVPVSLAYMRDVVNRLLREVGV